MSKLQELIAQRVAIEKQIVETRKSERESALAQIRSLMAENDLTVGDISGKSYAPRSTKKPASKVAPKYRDPATGNTWAGRGREPKWLAGKDKNQYLI